MLLIFFVSVFSSSLQKCHRIRRAAKWNVWRESDTPYIPDIRFTFVSVRSSAPRTNKVQRNLRSTVVFSHKCFRVGPIQIWFEHIVFNVNDVFGNSRWRCCCIHIASVDIDTNVTVWWRRRSPIASAVTKYVNANGPCYDGIEIDTEQSPVDAKASSSTASRSATTKRRRRRRHRRMVVAFFNVNGSFGCASSEQL